MTILADDFIIVKMPCFFKIAARAALDKLAVSSLKPRFSVKELDFVPSSNRAGGSEDNLTVMVVQFGGKHQMTTEDSI